jgi:hypothetical protein
MTTVYVKLIICGEGVEIIGRREITVTGKWIDDCQERIPSSGKAMPHKFSYNRMAPAEVRSGTDLKRPTDSSEVCRSTNWNTNASANVDVKRKVYVLGMPKNRSQRSE